MFPIIKNQVSRGKTELFHKGETTVFGKSLIGKSRKYFFANHCPSKFEKISVLNICDGAKKNYPKKQETSLRKNTNSESSRPEKKHHRYRYRCFPINFVKFVRTPNL